MEERPGTRCGKKSLKEGFPVDCRDWLEFAIVEVLYNKIKVEYRVPESVDVSGEETVESGSETGHNTFS